MVSLLSDEAGKLTETEGPKLDRIKFTLQHQQLPFYHSLKSGVKKGVSLLEGSRRDSHSVLDCLFNAPNLIETFIKVTAMAAAG